MLVINDWIKKENRGKNKSIDVCFKAEFVMNSHESSKRERENERKRRIN